MGIIIPFSEWTPDRAHAQSGMVEAQNAIAREDYYVQVPSFAVYSSSLSAHCQGFASFIDSTGNTRTYLADASHIFRLVSASLTAAATGLSVAVGDQVEFTKFGETILATHIADPLQGITMGNASFSAIATSTLKPQGRHIAVVREFAVLGWLKEGGTDYPERVRWCATNDVSDWDAAAATQADFQDLRGPGGWVQSVVGGEYGTIFRERSITRMTYVGSPLIFQFDEVVQNRGAWAQYATIEWDNKIFYIADDGIHMLVNGVENIPIGQGKVNRYFYNRLDATHKDRISSAIFPDESVVAFGFTTSGSAGGGDPDEILFYNWAANRFSWAEVDHEVLGSSLTHGYTMDGLDSIGSNLDDTDAFAHSLDSRVWAGGELQMSAVNRSHRLGHFTGAALTATLTPQERQLTAGQRSLVTGVRPLVEGTAATITVAPGTRTRLNEDVSFAAAASQNSDGICPLLSENRYHEFRTAISGGFDVASGIEVEAVATGVQ